MSKLNAFINDNFNHLHNPNAVSYTHLDVYKRQRKKELFTSYTAVEVKRVQYEAVGVLEDRDEEIECYIIVATENTVTLRIAM